MVLSAEMILKTTGLTIIKERKLENPKTINNNEINRCGLLKRVFKSLL